MLLAGALSWFVVTHLGTISMKSGLADQHAMFHIIHINSPQNRWLCKPVQTGSLSRNVQHRTQESTQPKQWVSEFNAAHTHTCSLHHFGGYNADHLLIQAKIKIACPLYRKMHNSIQPSKPKQLDITSTQILPSIMTVRKLDAW